MSTLCRCCFFALVLLSTTACTTVKPWQKGNLSRPEMSISAMPLETSLSDHIYFSKEGSSSGTAVSGGGCGCN